MLSESVQTYVTALVRKRFKGYVASSSVLDMDDLVQTGMEAAIKALGSYTPGSSSKNTWIYNYVEQAVLNYIRKHSKSDVAYHDEDDVPDDSLDIDIAEGYSLLVECCKALLSDKELRVIELLHLTNDHTQDEVADVMGLTKNQVKYALATGLRKLRNSKELSSWYSKYAP